MNTRDRLIDVMLAADLERHEVAELLQVERELVDGWMLPMESTRRVDVPEMAVELLELKIALRKGRVVTTLQYADVEAAIDWLRRVFGMELKLRVDGDDGRPEHAQLLHGHEVVMLGPYADTGYGRLLRKPGDLGGCETQAPYLVVPDADVIWQRVRDAGGEIVIDIVDQSYGGRGFTCRDPQGHLWNVGTYDPFAA